MPEYGHPHARLIHPLTPPRALLKGLTPRQRADAHRAHADTWHHLRSEGVTASNASAILGVDTDANGAPRTSLTALYAEKVHGVRQPSSPQAQIGQELEPALRARFTAQTGLRLRRVGMLANKEQEWMRCNPDALTSDGAGVEFKTTTEHRQGWQWDAYPSDHATAQAAWSMAVTGATHWWVAVLFRDTGDFKVYRVERDAALITTLVSRASVFWHGHVLTLTAPPVDAHPSTAAAQAAMYRRPAENTVEGGEAAANEARSLKRLNELIKDLEEQRDAAHARIKGMLGDTGTELTAHGVVVARWRRNGNFAHAQWAREHPEEAAEYMRPTTALDRKAALASSTTAPDFIGRRFTLTTPTGKGAQILGLEPPVETMADVA